MKINKNKVILTIILYGILVFFAEITLGNSDFPFNLWVFTKIPTWMWSLPVHLSGIILLFIWNYILKEKHIIWPIFLSSVFFLIAEIANWFVFNFFSYSAYPFGQAGSFWIVIILYLGLCAICSIFFRIGFMGKIN